jgi:hypothetical protein
VRQSSADARPFALSVLVFKLPLEHRTFLLHFISHIRTIVKHEQVSTDRLMAEFSVCCKCSRDLITAIYNNRRTILQPSCSSCATIVGLADAPTFLTDTFQIVCGACSSK